MVTKGPWHAPCCTADPVLPTAPAPRPGGGKAARTHGRSTINGRRPRRARSPSPAERRSRCSEDLPYFSPRHDPLPSRTPTPLHITPPLAAAWGPPLPAERRIEGLVVRKTNDQSPTSTAEPMDTASARR